MAGLNDSDILDLVVTTERKIPRNSIEFQAQSLQDYVVMGRLIDKKVEVKGSMGVEETLMLKSMNQAQFRGLYDEDKLEVGNLLTKMFVPWKNISNGWVWDRMEVDRNTGEWLVNNMIKPRRTECEMGIWDKIEEDFFTDAPLLTDKLRPYNLKYYVVKDTSNTGFYGGAPSGHTEVAGINPTTYDKFKNYTGHYTNITPDDLLEAMRLAAYKTNFKSPKFLDSTMKSPGEKNKLIMTTYTVASGLKKLIREQNDNLGSDLDAYNGASYFNKIEILPVPQLDVLNVDDVYMINFDTFYPIVLKDNYMRESDPIQVAGKHTVYTQFIDMTYNLLCKNRRANAVIAKA
jgi:hypothetical protein